MKAVTEQAAWLRESAGVRHLEELAAIRVVGPDARSWLNGQVTNQVALLESGEAVYALVLTVKGRILSDAWVCARDAEDLVVLVPGARREAILAHLDKYVVMEDVDVEPVDLAVLSVQGPRAADVVASRGAWPCPRVGDVGFDVLVAPSERQEVLQALVDAAASVGGGAVDLEAWELARLRAATPAYGADFDESAYPQEAGLERRAVSFDKGCYLGQEVVCMLENRGQLRRHLVRLAADRAPARGAELRVGDAKVGEVRSAALDPATGGWLALGYVKRKHATPGTALELVDADGGEGAAASVTVGEMV